MTRKKRKKKRATGTRWPAVVAAAMAVAVASAVGFAAEKPRKAAAPTALIAGTVFRDSGFSLPGAGLTVDADPEPGVKVKFKRVSMVSDSRGEFAIRLPAVPMRYVLTVSAAGFETWKKQFSIQGEERLDLSVVLTPRAR
jgi:hypothetical protein